jgi:hypothetical protein
MGCGASKKSSTVVPFEKDHRNHDNTDVNNDDDDDVRALRSVDFERPSTESGTAGKVIEWSAGVAAWTRDLSRGSLTAHAARADDTDNDDVEVGHAVDDVEPREGIGAGSSGTAVAGDSSGPTHSQSDCQEEDALTDALLRAAATAAEAEDRATNYDMVRAVLFRSKLRDPWGFGLGLSSTNAVLVTDLVIGGLADGQLQVRLTPFDPPCLCSSVTVVLLTVSVTCCLVRHQIKSFFFVD